MVLIILHGNGARALYELKVRQPVEDRLHHLGGEELSVIIHAGSVDRGSIKHK